MKNRINSGACLRGDKGVSMGQNCATRKESKPETHNHYPIPKIPKKDLPVKQAEPQQKHSQRITSNNLHKLISNFVNSSDRIANLVREDDRSCPYQVYLQNRNKIVQILDSFIQQQETHHTEPFKSEKNNQKEDYLNKQLQSIRLSIDKAIHRKKRSKSNGLIATLPINQQVEKIDQLSTIKYLLVQQSSKVNALRAQKVQLEKEIVLFQSKFAYLELLAFKSQQLLLQNLIDDQKSLQFSLIEKEKVKEVISSIHQTILHTRSQQTQSQQSFATKLKKQAQSLVLYISEMRKKALAILKKKQQSLGRLQQEQAHFQQLKTKVNHLNAEIGQLAEEVDRKDELIEYVKLENINLKEDLRGMQEMVRQTKKDYQALADQHYLLAEKTKMLQTLLQGKEEQLGQLIVEIESKNKELIAKLQEIQAKEEDMVALKDEQTRRQQSSARVISTLSEEKKLLALQKQRKENELRETQSKVRFLEEQGSILQKKIESVFNEEEDYKMRISMLEDKVECLQRENLQLYKDMRGLQQEETEFLQQSKKQLQDECTALHKQMAEDKKKIQFYEQQLLQLAKMTDTTYLERIIEEQQIKIMQLQQKTMPQLTISISPIPEENSDQLQHQNSPIQSMDGLLSTKGREEENPQGWSKAESKGLELLQDLLDCIPSFEDHIQRHTVMSDHSNSPHQLILSREQHSGVTDLSFYEIHVINQDLNRIDSHTAVTPKKVAVSNSLVPPVYNKALSNHADFQLSQIDDRQQPLLVSKKVEDTNSDDQQSDKLSEVSRNVNAGREVQDQQRMNDVEEEVVKQLTPVKSLKIQDLLMSEASSAESRRKALSPMKNVDSEQEIKAEIRFSGDIQRRAKGSKIAEGTYKGNILISNSNGKVHRARSCMGKDN